MATSISGSIYLVDPIENVETIKQTSYYHAGLVSQSRILSGCRLAITRMMWLAY
jgi:hypothetical protein